MKQAQDFLTISRSIHEDLIAYREHLHRFPELSFEEFETSAFIKEKLDAWDIPYTEGWVKTGIVAEINGEKEGATVCIRADIDALPIQEQNQCDYRSQKDGRMHACGHDVHTTSALGAAYILKQMQADIQGSIKILFQPGEEKLPGGAVGILAEGALGDPLPDAIIGLHVEPSINVGEIGFKAGNYMASSDEIHIELIGEGGHAAAPHKTADTVNAMAHLIVELQQVTSRFCPPDIPSVLTFGKVDAPGATNVIPSRVNIQGTFRTFDENWRKEAHERIASVCEAIADLNGLKIELNIIKGYPVLKNDKKMADLIKRPAIELFGKGKVHSLDIRMTAEDFASYSKVMPALFYRLGVRNEDKGIVHSVHHPKFDADPDSLFYGASSLAFFAWELLAAINGQ